METVAPPIFQGDAAGPRKPRRIVTSAPHPLRSAYDALQAVKPYLLLIRFYLHLNYNVVVIGSVFFPGPHVPVLDRVAALLKMYLCFNVCLYGGIYTMNAVTDAEEDRRHPSKRARPIPSGAVSEAAGTVAKQQGARWQWYTACLRRLLCFAPNGLCARAERLRRKDSKPPEIEICTTDK